MTIFDLINPKFKEPKSRTIFLPTSIYYINGDIRTPKCQGMIHIDVGKYLKNRILDA